ncbi:helix-turn-helix transcriptional regulator [Bifidobacterium pseudocatenulatum]|uniref:helix-turn-helix transcriptional regulator n=1 Tax=Bifidobacterium pseudocatenulatum TaxID=28026 RepID=UPI0034A5347D
MGLKELRMKRGLSQRQLADKSGVHYVEIAQIETRKRNVRTLSLDTALRLCDALRVANPRKLLDSDSETSADSK